MTIRNFKKLIVKQWEMMGDADVDVILRTIKDPAAVYLHQHLTRGGVKVFDPPEEIPTGPEFIRQLPERTRHAEETAFIADIFKHAAQAHEHLSAVCANISALAKITDKTTLHTVIMVLSDPWSKSTYQKAPEPGRRQAGQDDRRGET